MRINGDATGYVMHLSRRDTERWAERPSASWPCSDFAGSALRVEVDRNGLCDLAVNGRDSDGSGDELDALVGDHLPPEYRHLWPTWEPRSTAPAPDPLGSTRQKVNPQDTLAVLEALGFDRCKLEAGSIHVGCSQCGALVINRVPTHEQGCPNSKHECAGCNALLPRGQKYCQDCAA